MKTKHLITGNERPTAGQFVVHTLAATLGTLIVYALLVTAAGKLFPGWQPGIWSTVAICGVAGFVLGNSIMIRYPSKLASWVWTLPAIWVVVSMSDFASRGHIDWQQVWVNFFTNQCGSSECVYELTGTFPLIASLAYSASAWLRVHDPAQGTL